MMGGDPLSWLLGGSLGGALFIGAAPVIATKLIVRLYPPNSARRQELLAELFVVPFRERLFWVGQCLVLGLTEGLSQRWTRTVDEAQQHGERPLAAVAIRAFDVAVAVAALLLLSPLLALAMLAIKLESRGPVLFRRTRMGRDGSTFAMMKLRTVTVRLTDSGLERGVSVTKVGRLLSRLSIDELPLFWNVVRGDMSLVGPRPALAEQPAEWDAELRERFSTRPGITGLGHTSPREQTSNEVDTRLDLEYVRNKSLRLNLEILARTVHIGLRRKDNWSNRSE
jgi:lipopolysaccharide/colanic/teichoic acid biosynthesis glycosyltransferase